MDTKMNGCGLKLMSQVFVVKEPELEIGNPTDVKHVAHIGTDGVGDGAPSWMNAFKTGPVLTATSFRGIREKSSSSSNGFDRQVESPNPQRNTRVYLPLRQSKLKN